MNVECDPDELTRSQGDDCRRLGLTLLPRRNLLVAGLGLGGSAAVGVHSRTARAAPAPAGEGLNARARALGMSFGAAARLDQLQYEGDLRAVVLTQCGELTPEIGLKWAVIEPRRGALNFSEMDDLSAFCIRHGLKLRGHTLMWHRSVPAWAEEDLRRNRDWSVVSRYFASVMPRYGASTDNWDVVNEPIETGYRMDGLRRSVFLDAFGDGYVHRALATARLFAPAAKLFINEYDLEYDTSEQKARRYLLLKLLERLKAEGAPLDGVGLQSHLNLARGPVSEPELRGFLRNVEDLGLLIRVTELDVKEADLVASVQVRDRAVADETRRYLEIVLGARRVTGVTTWGLTDRGSWLVLTTADLARFPGAWGAGEGPGLNRGLPYDGAMRAKPMYNAVSDAFGRR